MHKQSNNFACAFLLRDAGRFLIADIFALTGYGYHEKVFCKVLLSTKNLNQSLQQKEKAAGRIRCCFQRRKKEEKGKLLSYKTVAEKDPAGKAGG